MATAEHREPYESRGSRTCSRATGPSLIGLTVAGVLMSRPEPDCRARRTYLHLSYSYVSPFGPAILVTHDPEPTSSRARFLAGGFSFGAARNGLPMLHRSRRPIHSVECLTPHQQLSRCNLQFLLFALHLVWLNLSSSSIDRTPLRVLGVSRFGASPTDRRCRPPDTSNFCCLPGRAGGTPIGV